MVYMLYIFYLPGGSRQYSIIRYVNISAYEYSH